MSAAPCIYVALGANLGDPAATLRDALKRLQEVSSAPVLASSLWTSTPVDCPPGSPPFVNAVARLAGRTGETPESLLDALQAMEREAGRIPKVVMNEPRPLDLDLLAWDALMLDTPRLVLPHPRAHLRRFVLAPWAEIGPGFVIPGTGRTVGQLLAMLDTHETLGRLPLP